MTKSGHTRFTFLIVAAALIATPFAGPQSMHAQETDDPTASRIFDTAGNMYNQNEYESAITQYDRVLENYPNFSNRRDAQYFAAMAHFQLRQYDKAAERFESLRDSLPNFNDYRRSDGMLYALGRSQQLTGLSKKEEGVEDLEAAVKTFEQLFSNFDEPRDGADAWFSYGESYYHLNEIAGSKYPIEKAAERYKQIVDRFADAPVRPRAMYLYGVCKQQEGQYASALKVFDQFLNEYADHELNSEVLLKKAMAVQQIGFAHKNAGDSDSAQQYLTQADSLFSEVAKIEVTPETTWLRSLAMYNRAFGLLEFERYSDAATVFGTIANDFPDFKQAEACRKDAGKYYYIAKDYVQAEKWLNSVIGKDNQYKAEATHWLAKTKLEQGEHQAAFQLANGALSNAGDFEPELRFDVAQALEKLPKRQKEAIDVYLKIADDFPEHRNAAQSLYFAAFGLMEIDEPEQALAKAEQFIEKHRSHADLPWVKDVKARAAFRLKDMQLAKKTYTDLVTNHSNIDRVDAWNARLGWISYFTGKKDEAIATMSQAVSQMNDGASRAQAYHIIGTSQFDLKNYVKAIESLENSLKENPQASNRASVVMLTARAYSQRNQNEKAIELVSPIWDQAKDPVAAYWLAEFHYQLKDYAQAEPLYQSVLDAGDSSVIPDALFGLAWTQSRQGKSAEAEKLFSRLVSEFPNSSVAKDALVGRGQTLRQSGNPEQAIKDLDEFISKSEDPNAIFSATLERAICYTKLEQWKNAIRDFEALEKNISQSPDREVQIVFELAWAHRSDGDAEKSLQFFQRLVDEFPATSQAAEAHYIVGQSYYAQNDYDKAISHYQKALTDSKDPVIQERAAYKLGYSFFGKEQYQKALDAFKLQTDRFPNGDLHAFGLSMVAESHYWLRQHADAVTVFKKSIPSMSTDPATKTNLILALVHAAESANKTKEFELASQFAKTVIDEHGDSDFVGDALNEFAAAQKGLGNRQAAKDAWQRASDLPFGKASAKAYCMLGEEFFGDKEFGKAIEQFKLVLFAPTGEETSSSIKKWQAFAAYECARCYYVQVSSVEDGAQKQALIENAKKWFKHLVDKFPNDRLADDARKQLAKLNELSR